MYSIPSRVPLVILRKKKPKGRSTTQFGRPQGLSRSLHQSLGQGLYQGLFAGTPTPTNEVHKGPRPSVLTGEAADARVYREPLTTTPGSMVRNISLLRDETVTHTFRPEQGLVPLPEEQGRMLVLTNQRVIAFGQKDGTRETFVVPVEQVKSVAVNAGRRSKLMLFQGSLIVLAGVIIYVLLAYWLTGRVDGPTIPVLRMDLVAFLIFLAILSSVGMMSQFYFSKPDGEATFQGDGVTLKFPFRGKIAEDQIYEVLNATFAARQSIMGWTGTGYARPGLDRPNR